MKVQELFEEEKEHHVKTMVRDLFKIENPSNERDRFVRQLEKQVADAVGPLLGVPKKDIDREWYVGSHDKPKLDLSKLYQGDDDDELSKKLAKRKPQRYTLMVRFGTQSQGEDKSRMVHENATTALKDIFGSDAKIKGELYIGKYGDNHEFDLEVKL